MLRQSRPKLLPAHQSCHQHRSLWWWSRRTNDWANQFDQAVEKQLRRQQRLLQYRYVKAIRRRALWEREATHDHTHSLWPWHGPRWAKRLCIHKELISSRHGLSEENKERSDTTINDNGNGVQAKATEESTGQPRLDEEYEAWKRQVDADPYGAIFGRRLQNTRPNSSFLSWFLYTPEESQLSEKRAPQTTSMQEANSPRSEQSIDLKHKDPRSGDPCSPISVGQAMTTDEYQYDPISMRKIRKQAPPFSDELEPSTKVEENIPVKKFVAVETNITSIPISSEREYNAHDEAIDTRQQPSSRSTPATQESPEEPTSSQSQQGSRESEALFSGTTYESSNRIRGLTEDHNDAHCLRFETPAKTGDAKSPQISPGEVLVDSRTSSSNQLMPALDRYNSVDAIADGKPTSAEATERREALSRDFNSRQPDEGHFLSSISAAKSGNKFEGTNDFASKALPSGWMNNPLSITEMTQDTAQFGTEVAEKGLDVSPSRSHDTAAFSAFSSQQQILVPTEVLKEQEESVERTKRLQEDAAAFNEEWQNLKGKAVLIAEDLKDIYESHYGKINTRHRQQEKEPECEETSGSALDAPLEQLAEPMKCSSAIVKTEATATADTGKGDAWASTRGGLILHKRQAVADLALAVTRSELYLTKVDLIVQKSRLRSSSDLINRSDGPPMEIASSTYRILAFDPVTARVNVAEAPMSTVDLKGGPYHATKFLSKLKHPTKFLPYLQKYFKEGYEVVSGGNEMLIFKRVRPPMGEDNTFSNVDVVEGSAESEAMEYSQEPTKIETKPSSPSTGPRVRRQEAVFSGGRHKVKGQTTEKGSTFGETVSRVLLGGTLTAGFCYFVGVLTEMIRGDLEPPKTTRRAGIYSTEDSR